jgi:hypothetical protein
MPLTEAIVRSLLDAIETVVGADGSYTDKRDQVLEACSEDQETALVEFCSWFDELDEEPEEEGEEADEQKS